MQKLADILYSVADKGMVDGYKVQEMLKVGRSYRDEKQVKESKVMTKSLSEPPPAQQQAESPSEPPATAQQQPASPSEHPATAQQQPESPSEPLPIVQQAESSSEPRGIMKRIEISLEIDATQGIKRYVTVLNVLFSEQFVRIVH